MFDHLVMCGLRDGCNGLWLIDVPVNVMMDEGCG